MQDSHQKFQESPKCNTLLTIQSLENSNKATDYSNQNVNNLSIDQNSNQNSIEFEDWNLEIESNDEEFCQEINKINSWQDICYTTEVYSLAAFQGKKEEMQDRYCIDVENNFFCVFDGHKNDLIAQFLQNNLKNEIFNHPQFPNNIEIAIKESYQKIDNYLQEKKEYQNSGCVCIIAFFYNQNLYIVNLGDCRAALFSNNGKYINLSSDHTPQNRKDEVERINQNNGFFFQVHNSLRLFGELNVTRSFGDFQYKKYIINEPEIFVYNIKELYQLLDSQEIFLTLGTDGLWNYWNYNNCFNICKEGYQNFPKNAIEYIYENNNCFKDDVTIVSINLNQIIQ